jgi:hypothetical protein
MLAVLDALDGMFYTFRMRPELQIFCGIDMMLKVLPAPDLALYGSARKRLYYMLA